MSVVLGAEWFWHELVGSISGTPTTFSDSLFESQRHLSQMVRHVICSTQQDSQSVPGRVFGIVFLGHGAVLKQPLVRGETLKLRE